MPTYIASRLTGGNRILPDQITIDETGVTLKEPGIFSGEEKTIPFSRISSVEIDCPLIGFSTITIETTGEGGIVVDGFTKDEVTEMKKLIISKM